jgi:hypothetical protein
VLGGPGNLSRRPPLERAIDEVARLRSPGCDIVRLARALAPAELRAFRALARAELHVAPAVCLRRAPLAIGHWLQQLPPGSVRARVAADLAVMVPAFCALTGEDAAQVSLEVVASDACRKFHTDWVTLRAICTYAGPGTEVVPERYVRRAFLATDQGGLEATNRAIVADLRRVQKAAPGEWLLLKGEAWPGNEGRGAVHRSPTIANRGLRRVVLKIDSLAFEVD